MLSNATFEIDAHTVDALNPALFRFALRFVRRHEEAEDLVQETWLSALRGAPSFEGRSSLQTWLKTILRRRAVDQYRKVRATDALDDEHASELASPFEQLDSASAAALAAQALNQLSLLEQTAVTLCDVDDVERDDAARRMGVTRGHLRVLLHRGRQRIQQHLEQHGVQRD